MSRPAPPTPWIALIVISAVGLTLRVAAARGGLWLDEAWSATAAADVATPLGVFVGINHDNNHHLNTLWLQFVGLGAPSIVQRGLSIVSGAAAIVVAGLILAPRGQAATLLAAAMFAVSPILVTYGSEARGYAPMLLAVLILVLIVGRWLATDARARNPVAGLTILCLLGTLAQMTMIFGVLAVTGWVFARRWKAGPRRAAIDTIRLMAAPLLVTGATTWLIVRVLPGADGFHIGSYQPFRWQDLVVGQSDMLSYTLGISLGQSLAAVGLGLALAAFAFLPAIRERRALYFLAILGLPVGCALVPLGNVAIARYFLIGAAALLLLLAEVAATDLSAGGRQRGAAVVAIAGVMVASLFTDVRFLGNLRGDPVAAVAAMRYRSPIGATVTLDRIRAAPVIRAAAAQARFPTQITPCGQFLFVDRDGTEAFPARPTLCGHPYAAIASAHPNGLSGTHWTLYERHP